MKNIKNILGPVAATILTMFIANTAQANYSWTFDSAPEQGDCQAAFVGNNCTQSSTVGSTSIGVTATAWSSQTSSINSAIEAATLKRWNGLAVNSQGESTSQPQHATDNDGKLESILYSFDSAVKLSSITMGWHKDADFSLLRYDGTDVASLTGKTYSNLTSNGWELVGNYMCSSTTNCSNTSTVTEVTASVVGSATDQFNIDSGVAEVKSSSYWLITALNGAFWSGGSNYIGNDYFKVKNLSGTYTAPPSTSTDVPEPSVLFLISIGLIGWHFSSFKNKAV